MRNWNQFWMHKSAMIQQRTRPLKNPESVVVHVPAIVLMYARAHVHYIPTWGICTRRAGKTLQCSFSSVSTPTIVRVVSFFSIFRDLQDFLPFAPLRTPNFSKNLLNFFRMSTKILLNFCKIWSKFAQFWRNFTRISQNLREKPNVRYWPTAEGRQRRAGPICPILASNCARPAAALRDLPVAKLASQMWNAAELTRRSSSQRHGR